MNAAALYHWNSLLSQAFYLPLQIWEISLRNRLNAFLCSKYNAGWPHDQRAERNLNGNDKRRLGDALDRIAKDQNILRTSVSTDAVVAELSAGFWVSQLTAGYERHYAWRHYLFRVFPLRGALDRADISNKCSGILALRNRVAHHEPIFQLPLQRLRTDLETVTAAMCPTAFAYAQSTCTFAAVLANDPRLAKPAPTAA